MRRCEGGRPVGGVGWERRGVQRAPFPFFEGWDDAGPLVRAAQRLHDINNLFPGLRSESRDGIASATELMTSLEGGEINAAHIYPSEAGIFARVSSKSTQVAISAFRLQDPEDIQRWLEQRQTQIRHGDGRVMTDQLGGVYGWEAKPVPSLLRWGAEQSLGLLNLLSAEVPIILPYEGELPPAPHSLSPDYLRACAGRFLVESPADCVAAIRDLGGGAELCQEEGEKVGE